ncbi:MAG: hypothetical protein ACREPR_03740 [Brasilonema sp.]
MQCIHPDEAGVNCATITFCNSFQPMQEVDSPCVYEDSDEAFDGFWLDVVYNRVRSEAAASASPFGRLQGEHRFH